MAADLHIHIITKEFTEEHYKAMKAHTLGSKYGPQIDMDSGEYPYDLFNTRREDFERKHNCDLFSLANKTPNIWVGEVSWLKAGLSDDPDEFIPEIVDSINNIIGEDFRVIDDELINEVSQAFDTCKNTTGYNTTEKDGIINFLNKYKGEKTFTISW